MKGQVELVNYNKGSAALITENGGYTSFELLGHEVEPEDIITGDLEQMGNKTWYNNTKMEEIEVFVQDIYGSRQIALSIIS